MESKTEYAATLADVRAAADRIEPYAHRSPFATCSAIDRVGPAWSPDGTRHAFASARDGNPYTILLYVMNADGSGQIRLSDRSAFAPSWSPDGTRIVFGSERGSPLNVDIYAMNADGSGEIRLTYGRYRDQVPKWGP